MKTSTFVASLLATLLITSVASAAKKNFHSDLDQSNENPAPNPPIDPPPVATADYTFDDTVGAKTLCGKVTFSALTGPPTGLHIHLGAAGTTDYATKLIVGLPAAATSPILFNLALPANFEEALTNGALYINLHTAANPKGETGSTIYDPDVPPGIDVPCPAPTNPDGGTFTTSSTSSSGDAGGSTTSSTSSTGGTTSSTSTSSSTSSTSSGVVDAGKPAAAAAPAPESKSGCNSAGSPANALSLAFTVGLGIAAVTSRLRRKKR
jgi:hypothetical protein